MISKDILREAIASTFYSPDEDCPVVSKERHIDRILNEVLGKLAIAAKPEEEKHFIEVVPKCVWLTQDLKTTSTFSERGLWDTAEEAKAALEKAWNP